MITNADITLYNRKYDKATRTDTWHRTVVKGVSFYVDNKVSVGDTTVNSANVYKVRIPQENMPDGFVDEDTYFTKPDNAGLWTLQNNDYVVKGIVDAEIKSPKELNQLHRPYLKITTWSDNRRGGTPHLRIGGI